MHIWHIPILYPLIDTTHTAILIHTLLMRVLDIWLMLSLYVMPRSLMFGTFLFWMALIIFTTFRFFLFSIASILVTLPINFVLFFVLLSLA
jgi:hypothetical protein